MGFCESFLMEAHRITYPTQRPSLSKEWPQGLRSRLHKNRDRHVSRNLIGCSAAWRSMQKWSASWRARDPQKSSRDSRCKAVTCLTTWRAKKACASAGDFHLGARLPIGFSRPTVHSNNRQTFHCSALIAHDDSLAASLLRHPTKLSPETVLRHLHRKSR